jgi:YfiH family protein
MLCDPVLEARGLSHGFGARGLLPPEGTLLARQVHGTRVWVADGARADEPPEADVVLACRAGTSVGIVTADCVPILAAAEDGRAVAAIHAGWRGLAAGVIERGLEVLREVAGGQAIVAAVGPAARGCCYEIDEPVRVDLLRRHADRLDEDVLRRGRPGRYLLDLPRLAERVLLRQGIERERLGTRHRVCTICDAGRFESHRRDGKAAGRMRHFIVVGRSDVSGEG